NEKTCGELRTVRRRNHSLFEWEVASGHLTWEEGAELRLLLATARVHPSEALSLGNFDRAGTSRMEAASRWRIDRRRDVAFEDDAPPLQHQPRIRKGHGRQQRPGVRVFRVLIERLAGRGLDDLSEVHHGHAVAHVLHD